MSEESIDREHQILAPGESVDLGKGVTVKVYPPGFTHLKTFAGTLGLLLSTVATAQKPEEMNEAHFAAKLWARILPIVTNEALGLIDQCCVPTLSSLNLPSHL